MHENILYFLKQFGPPELSTPLSEEQLYRFSHLMPRSLFEFFSQYGLVSYFEGRYKTGDPKTFTEIIKNIFQHDSVFDVSKINVFAYSPFGKLFAWSDEYREFEIELYTGRVTCLSLTSNIDLKVTIDTSSSHFLPFELKGENCDVEFWDLYGEPLMDRCIKRLGPTSPLECYAFDPQLPGEGVTGRHQLIEFIHKVNLSEHYEELSKKNKFCLMDGNTLLRTIETKK